MDGSESSHSIKEETGTLQIRTECGYSERTESLTRQMDAYLIQTKSYRLPISRQFASTLKSGTI